MGYYVNPTDTSKEAFLHEEGREITDEEARNFDFSKDELPVCLVDNYMFTAAAIAYDPRERDIFLEPDGRSRKWYAVPRSQLKRWLPKAWGGGGEIWSGEGTA